MQSISACHHLEISLSMAKHVVPAPVLVGGILPVRGAAPAPFKKDFLWRYSDEVSVANGLVMPCAS